MAKRYRNSVGRSVKKAVRKNPVPFIVIALVVILILAGVFITYRLNPSLFDPFLRIFNFEQREPGGSGGGALNRSEGELVVEYVDVGQGDCAIIQFPDSKNMIIDGGNTGSTVVSNIKAAIDELEITKFDYVLLTHTDADHCASLDDAITYVFEVETVYLPKIKSGTNDLGLGSEYSVKNTAAYNNFVSAAASATYKDAGGNDSPAKLVFAEDTISFSDEENTYRFTMYCRDDAYYKALKSDSSAHPTNDVSPICVLEFNGRKLMFAGDANASTTNEGARIKTSAERNWLDTMASAGISDDDFDVDVLKVAHHGGEDSSGADFLSFIDAKYAVVSVGGNQSTDKEKYNLYINTEYSSAADFSINANGQYGHPTSAVCAENGRLANSGIVRVYYTWFNGTTKCRIDKEGNISFECKYNAVLSNGVVSYV